MISEELSSQWEQRLAEYETSGKSIATWCKEHSIRVNQFYYWRKRLRLDQTIKDQPMKWLPLGLEQANLAPDYIAVHVGQVTVELRKGFDQNLFREIVQILQTI
jgi:transposase-like protein